MINSLIILILILNWVMFILLLLLNHIVKKMVDINHKIILLNHKSILGLRKLIDTK